MRLHKILLTGLTVSLALAASIAAGAESNKDWGSYNVENNGYGYLTANFPDTFTSDFFVTENSTSISQKVEALLLTMTQEEKIGLIEAEGDWAGTPRLGIPQVSAYIPQDTDEVLSQALMTAATYSSRDVGIFAQLLAEEIENSGANLLQISFEQITDESEGGNSAETFGSDKCLAQTLGAALSDLLSQYHVISNSAWHAENSDGMTDEEIDAAAAARLTAIGNAGYLGMVQISRDGKAAIDSDAPDRIRLSVPFETENAVGQRTLLEDGAVLLKNEDGTLPLKDSDGAEVVIVGRTEGSELIQNDAKKLEDGLLKAEEEGKKYVLVIENSQPVDISRWVDSCDAVLMLWSDSTEAEQVKEDIFAGKLNPSGKLPSPWTNGPEEWGIGYGLTYADFKTELKDIQPASSDDEEYGYDVTVRVKNEGSVAGKNTIPLFLGDEKGENTALCTFAQTDLLEAGGSMEITLHISQDALVDSEGKVTGEKRTLFVGIPTDGKSVRQELEIKPARAGAEITVDAPENAKTGKEFEIKISTPPNVISLQLTDSDGNAYQPADLLKENLGDSIMFTYKLAIDHTGEADICVRAVTVEGPSEETVNVRVSVE